MNIRLYSFFRRDFLNKVKYPLSFILILVIIIITGALYYNYIPDFSQNCYYADLDLSNHQDTTKITKDLYNLSIKHNADVFFTNSQTKNSNEDELVIYGSDGVKKYLSDELEINEGYIKSFFSSNISIQIKDLKDFENNDTIEQTLYFIGEKNNIEALYLEASEAYMLDILYNPNKYSEFSKILICWFIFGLVVLTFTVFEIQVFQKEKTVKIINGKSTAPIILKKMLLDNLIIILIVLSAFLITSIVCYTGFYLKDFVAFIIALIVINSLFYLALIPFNLRKAFSNAQDNKTVLSFLFITKVLVLVFVISLLPINIYFVSQSINFYNQQKFIEDHKNHNIFSFNPLIDDSDEESFALIGERDTLGLEFFNKYKADALILRGIDDIFLTEEATVDSDGITVLPNEDDKKAATVEMNLNAYKYYFNDTDFYNKFDIESEIKKHDWVLLIPNKIKAQDLGGIYNEHYICHSYDNIDLTYISSNLSYFSKLVSNPIIIIRSDNYFISNGVPLENCLFKASKKQVENFLNENATDPSKWTISETNLQDIYSFNRDAVNKVGLLSLIICLMLLFLEGAISFSIMKLYFSLYKKELAVRRILGRSLFKQTIKIFALSIVLIIVCSLVAPWFVKEFGLSGSVIPGALIITALDIIVFFISVRSFERQSFAKILKGGAI